MTEILTCQQGTAAGSDRTAPGHYALRIRNPRLKQTRRGRARSLLALTLLGLVTGCTTGDDTKETGTFRVTREDGSVIAFEGSLRAWCGPPRYGKGTALHLGAGGPVEGEQDPRSYWVLISSVDRLERSPILSLLERPIDSTTWSFFVNDAETGNESAAKTEGSSGTIEVTRWGCSRGDAVHVVFNAVVGSEYAHGELVRAAGTITTEIGDTPPSDPH